jgi:hypothetical protein
MMEMLVAHWNSRKTSAVGTPPPWTRCGIGILLAVTPGEVYACCEQGGLRAAQVCSVSARNIADTDDVVQQVFPSAIEQPSGFGVVD